MRALSTGVGVLALITAVRASFGATLPVITVQPTNQVVLPGSTAVLNISATGATSYQWRFDGSDISGAAGSSLTIINAQLTNSGYYYALAKNAVGWVPSQMAYLSVVDTPGTVPFNTRFHTNEEADYQQTIFGSCSYTGPITNGTALLMAGPALDQMQPVGLGASVLNGFFNGGNRSVPTVAAGQALYYQAAVSYPCLAQPSGVFTQLSTCVQTIAGGGAYLIPTVTNLFFPGWIEWPYFDPGVTSTNVITQVRIPGETFTLTNEFSGYTDLGMPNYQWRMGGAEIGFPSNFVCEVWAGCIQADGVATLTFTNFQLSNAGVYDVKVLGNNWMIGPKTLISVQLTNGPGVFQSPRRIGANFISDLLGAAGRNYAVQLSTNLSSWSDLLTLTNLTGTVTFTNPLPAASAAFYRARLLPL